VKALLQLVDGLQACFPQDGTKPGVTVSYVPGAEPHYVSACRFNVGLSGKQVEAAGYGKTLDQAVKRCAKKLAEAQGLLRNSDPRTVILVALAKRAK
jgi:hypothetical protein